MPIQTKKASNLGWIAPDVQVLVNTETKSVQVIDGIIQGYLKAPTPGKIAIDNAKRITFGWRFKTKGATNQAGTLDYRMTYQKAGGAASITSAPLGYANRFNSDGACTITATIWRYRGTGQVSVALLF